MKTKNTREKWPEGRSHPSIDFAALSKRVFDDKKVTIGGEPITEQMRDLFREQAKYILTSQLWDVIYSTALNEAANLALKNSLNFDHVQFAKALDYWNTLVLKLLVKLAK